MPAEITEGGSILLTGDAIEVGRWIAIREYLKLEIKTGLRHSRGSMMKLANQITGKNDRTKRAAWESINEHIAKHVGEYMRKEMDF